MGLEWWAIRWNGEAPDQCSTRDSLEYLSGLAVDRPCSSDVADCEAHLRDEDRNFWIYDRLEWLQWSETVQLAESEEQAKKDHGSKVYVPDGTQDHNGLAAPPRSQALHRPRWRVGRQDEDRTLRANPESTQPATS